VPAKVGTEFEKPVAGDCNGFFYEDEITVPLLWLFVGTVLVAMSASCMIPPRVTLVPHQLGKKYRNKL
jgi:hypothetical protein